MELNARIAKGMNQVRIHKRGENWTSLMTVKDAKKAWEEGKVTKYNKAFARLVENDFDVTLTLAWYQQQRDAIAAERKRAGTSATDEG